MQEPVELLQNSKIEKTDAHDRRHRLLPARVCVLLTLTRALALWVMGRVYEVVHSRFTES